MRNRRALFALGRGRRRRSGAGVESKTGKQREALHGVEMQLNSGHVRLDLVFRGHVLVPEA